MPISIGSNEISDATLAAAGVEAVFVGSTQVWPTIPYELYYGTKYIRHSGSGNAIYNFFDPGITMTTPQSGDYTAIDWGITWTRYGFLDQALLTGSNTQRIVTTSGADISSGSKSIVVNHLHTGTGGNYGVGSKALVDVADDDGAHEVWARFDDAGVCLFVSEGDLWPNAVKNGTGKYVVTPGFNMVKTFALATPNIAGLYSISGGCVGQIHYMTATSVEVTTWAGVTASDMGFSIMVLK